MHTYIIARKSTHFRYFVCLCLYDFHYFLWIHFFNLDSIFSIDNFDREFLDQAFLLQDFLDISLREHCFCSTFSWFFNDFCIASFSYILFFHSAQSTLDFLQILIKIVRSLAICAIDEVLHLYVLNHDLKQMRWWRVAIFVQKFHKVFYLLNEFYAFDAQRRLCVNSLLSYVRCHFFLRAFIVV